MSSLPGARGGRGWWWLRRGGGEEVGEWGWKGGGGKEVDEEGVGRGRGLKRSGRGEYKARERYLVLEMGKGRGWYGGRGHGRANDKRQGEMGMACREERREGL